jgi:hypothetical protein
MDSEGFRIEQMSLESHQTVRSTHQKVVATVTATPQKFVYYYRHQKFVYYYRHQMWTERLV